MFVVYHIESCRSESFATQAGAKRSCTAKNKNAYRRMVKNCNEMARKVPEFTPMYAVTTSEDFNNNINTMTTTYNMLDPDRRPIPIRRSEKGGCCDPATETYHSA